jgi:acyl-CoA thioesterase I
MKQLSIWLVLFNMVQGACMANPERIVFLGDSITDGNTYPLLIQQALREAGQPVPVCINAGIGGDTAKGMHARLDRDVLSRQPTLVTFNAGVNDCLQNVPLTNYVADVTAITDRLNAEKIPLLILTTIALGETKTNAQPRLAEYNAFLRDFARQRGCRLAELYKPTEGVAGILETDDIHPNFEGQRLIARAVLDALGYDKVVVPHELHLELLPGIIREWQVRALPYGEWKEYRLPEQEAQAQPWHEQERQRGFALSLEKVLGKADKYEARATLSAERDHSAFLNTGAALQVVWLDGKEIYRNTSWTGWHAGKERILVQLRQGANEIRIETGSQFFLSVTDTAEW